MPKKRLDYAASCAALQRAKVLAPGEIPPPPKRMPRYDDRAPLGLNFFRTRLTNVELIGLSIPRTYFGRSLIDGVSFRGSDLSESSACWNDFVRVDFSEAVLAQSDLRASNFEGCSFVDCDMSGADLRHSNFESCDFGGARMAGTKLTRAQARGLELSKSQRDEIDWQSRDGEEPPGG